MTLLFHTDRSTPPYRVGFPILVSNLVQAALQQSGLAEVEAPRAGVLAADGFPAKAACPIEGPDHYRRTVEADEQGCILPACPRCKPAIYTINAGGAPPRKIGFFEFARPARRPLAAVDQLQFNDQLTVTASTAAVKSDRALWWGIALAAFVALLVEWWWYQRPARVAS